MKKSAIAIIGSVLLLSCQSKQQGQTTEAETDFHASDDVVEVVEHVDTINIESSSILKIDDAFYNTIIQSTPDSIVDHDVFYLTNFTRKKDADHFHYYMLDKLNLSDSFESHLIAEDYSEEWACWLVNYSDGNFIDALEIYYGNSEGYKSIDSYIKPVEKILLVNEYNIYETPEEKISMYKITEDGHFEETETNY